MNKKLSFTIEKHGKYYTAQDEKYGMITQGKDLNELFDMIADAYKCVFEIKVPWYQWSVGNLLRDIMYRIYFKIM